MGDLIFIEDYDDAKKARWLPFRNTFQHKTYMLKFDKTGKHIQYDLPSVRRFIRGPSIEGDVLYSEESFAYNYLKKKTDGHLTSVPHGFHVFGFQSDEDSVAFALRFHDWIVPFSRHHPHVEHTTEQLNGRPQQRKQSYESQILEKVKNQKNQKYRSIYWVDVPNWDEADAVFEKATDYIHTTKPPLPRPTPTKYKLQK